jgi:hypothetical protein
MKAFWFTGIVVFPKARLNFKGYPSTPVKTIVEVPSYLRSIKGRDDFSSDNIQRITDLIIDSSRKTDLIESGFFY